MPIWSETYGVYPIFIAHFEGKVVEEDIFTMFRDCALVADRMGKVYRVTDTSKADSTFADVLRFMRYSNQGIAGSSADKRVKTIYVGAHPLMKLIVNLASQASFGSVKIPIFHTVPEALTYIITEIEES